MEIERKFIVDLAKIPFDYTTFPFEPFSQAYISVNPTIRIRQEGERHVLCIKGKGDLAREEYEILIDAEQFASLMKKKETNVVEKDRYVIPLEGGLNAELDVFKKQLEGLCLVEVEFESEAQAESFIPPSWFGKEVTYDERYKNTTLSIAGLPKRP